MFSIRDKKYIIFDLDGTLINEANWYVSKWEKTAVYVYEKYKLKKFFNSIMAKIKEKGFFYKTLVNDILEENYNIKNIEMIKDIVKFYKEVDVDIRVLEGVEEVLIALLNSDKRLGIITNGYTNIQLEKIEKSKLKKYFSKIIVAEEYPKPDKTSYKLMTEYFDSKYEDMVYVGDNPNVDFYGAKLLNMITVRIKKGIFKNDRLDKNFEADYEINTIEDLLKINTLI